MEACRAAYSLISSAAISLTAFLARALRLFQSAPPILSSVGASPAHIAGDQVELVHRDEQPVAGMAALGRGAYSITRYSRVAPPPVRWIIST